MQKIIVSNVRFPEDQWLQLKTAAYQNGMSVNEYFKYLYKISSLMTSTGISMEDRKKSGYEAMDKFLKRKIIGKPMGMSDDDKAIYDP